MIAIYRGEDTDFAGQEPIQVKINTPYDLTGYTADILFGSVVKHFEPDEVGTKTLGLSFTAEETAGFFPGRGYASIKVYDTEGRVAILKRFVIDVRFRDYEKSPLNIVDVAEVVQSLENVREVVSKMDKLTIDDDVATIKEVVNEILEAAKKRTEFTPLTQEDLAKVPAATIVAFTECMRKLESVAKDAEKLDLDSDIADVKNLLNDILEAFGGAKTVKINIQDPEASVNSLLEWAKEVSRIIRTQRV